MAMASPEREAGGSLTELKKQADAARRQYQL